MVTTRILMWCAAPCSGLGHFHVAGQSAEKSSNSQKKRECNGWLIVCVKLAGVSLNVCELLERQRAILGDKYDHTVVWQIYYSKLTFRACRPRPFL